MRYLMLIYGVEAQLAKMPPKDMGALLGEWNAFNEEILASGIVESSSRLRPTATASTVRARDGKTTITDGPFAETKEQLGGFYVLRVAHLDDALAWAKRVPSTRYGSVELRPLWEREDYMK